MFISDNVLKALAEDFARERHGEPGARRRLPRTRAWRISKLRRVRKTRHRSATTVRTEQN